MKTRPHIKEEAISEKNAFATCEIVDLRFPSLAFIELFYIYRFERSKNFTGRYRVKAYNCVRITFESWIIESKLVFGILRIKVRY